MVNNSVEPQLPKNPYKDWLLCAEVPCGIAFLTNFYVIIGFQSNLAKTIATSFEQNPLARIYTSYPQLERTFLGIDQLLLLFLDKRLPAK